MSSYNIQLLERRCIITSANDGHSKSEHSRKRERGLGLREKKAMCGKPSPTTY
jgi:hypothetical protein